MSCRHMPTFGLQTSMTRLPQFGHQKRSPTGTVKDACGAMLRRLAILVDRCFYSSFLHPSRSTKRCAATSKTSGTSKFQSNWTFCNGPTEDPDNGKKRRSDKTWNVQPIFMDVRARNTSNREPRQNTTFMRQLGDSGVPPYKLYLLDENVKDH